MKNLKVTRNTPWKVEYLGGTGGIRILDSRQELVAHVGFNNQEEAMAIAELIAAAPELLEATLGLAKLVSR